MATSYELVYDVFQSQISDIEFNSLSTVSELQKRYLINAIPKFRACIKNLDSRDDDLEEFDIDLIDDEINILGNLMVIEYLSSQIVNLDLIKQSLNSKDFYMTSQAEHLKRLLEVRNERKREISKMIIDYTYTFSDLTKLR